MSYHDKAADINGKLKKIGFDLSGDLNDLSKEQLINAMLYYAKVCVRSGRHPTSFRNISEMVFKDVVTLKIVDIEANGRTFPILQVDEICK